MVPSAASYNVPSEIAEAARHGRREGAWIRSHCPYCDPESRKSRSLAIGERGWVCHRNACEKLQREERDRVRLEVAKVAGSDEARRRHKALQIIEASSHIRPGCPVDLYLRRRHLRPIGSWWPSDLRRHNRLWHPDTRREYVGMIAVVRNLAGVPVAVHRTYLMPDGRRADDATLDASVRVKDAKRSLAPLLGGHSVLLGHDPNADTIGIAEGIESTLALQMRIELPCRSGLNAAGMSNMRIGPEIRRVIIGPDIGDKESTGTKAAFALRHRLQTEAKAQGRRLVVEILPPPIRKAKGDWADWAEQIAISA